MNELASRTASTDGSDAGRAEAWRTYQPGFRFSQAPVGSREFYRQVEDHRYSLEPHILDFARFADWSGRDVLEAGCGIGTDASQFAKAGARYTGIDFSSTAVDLARRRFELEGLRGEFVPGSITSMPFEDQSFDLVYSYGVIHHLPEPEAAVHEFRRVLRPGGVAKVMVYHRNSLNYWFTILVVKRALSPLALFPRLAMAISREPRDVIEGQRELLRRHGFSYLRDRQMFLSRNTDGPQNPISHVYSRAAAEAMFSGFARVDLAIRYLNLRSYPGGQRMAASSLGRKLETRYGWHLLTEAQLPSG